MSNSVRPVVLLGVFRLAPVVLHGDDWPEWRDAGHAGVWNDTGILESLAPCCTFMRIPSAITRSAPECALGADGVELPAGGTRTTEARSWRMTGQSWALTSGGC